MLCQKRWPYDQIIHGTFASAAVGLAAGSVSKSNNPALERALRIIAARKKQKMTDQKVITLPSLGESLISFFNEIVPPEIRAQIEREKQLESADQREAARARANETSGPRFPGRLASSSAARAENIAPRNRKKLIAVRSMSVMSVMSVRQCGSDVLS